MIWYELKKFILKYIRQNIFLFYANNVLMRSFEKNIRKAEGMFSERKKEGVYQNVGNKRFTADLIPIELL